MKNGVCGFPSFGLEERSTGIAQSPAFGAGQRLGEPGASLQGLEGPSGEPVAQYGGITTCCLSSPSHPPPEPFQAVTAGAELGQIRAEPLAWWRSPLGSAFPLPSALVGEASVKTGPWCCKLPISAWGWCCPSLPRISPVLCPPPAYPCRWQEASPPVRSQHCQPRALLPSLQMSVEHHFCWRAAQSRTQLFPRAVLWFQQGFAASANFLSAGRPACPSLLPLGAPAFDSGAIGGGSSCSFPSWAVHPGDTRGRPFLSSSEQHFRDWRRRRRWGSRCRDVPATALPRAARGSCAGQVRQQPNHNIDKVDLPLSQLLRVRAQGGHVCQSETASFLTLGLEGSLKTSAGRGKGSGGPDGPSSHTHPPSPGQVSSRPSRLACSLRNAIKTRE